MKIIKKITAMMLSIMMVLGMCSVVSAAGTGAEKKGTITIDNAIVNQEYKIYKILDLVSYESKKDESGKEIGLYSYKPATGWENFFDDGQPGHDYATVNKDGYVEWREGAKADELAKVALKYTTTKNIKETKSATATATTTTTTTTVTFTGLELGYYLVDSSLGTLCGLDTTNPDMTIQEKNDVPSVEKKIEITNDTLAEKNSANLGEQVIFKTTISVKPGANNYVLHDKMDSNLAFGGILHVYDDYNDSYQYVAQSDLQPNTPADFQLINKPKDCTFELKFLDKFYKNRAELINQKKVTTITVEYCAIVTDGAIVNKPMNNTAWLTYGDNNTESNKSETNTYTYGIPVFKHTGTGENKQALAGAEFKLYTDAKCTEANVLKFKTNSDKYRYTETDGNEILTSPATGMINIEGIKEGTYYLKETKAPKGYNLLKDAIEITIDANGQIKIDGVEVERVEVKNNAGSILPSTGGIGTTIFYIAGALLVLAAGVVLIAKKRTDSK